MNYSRQADIYDAEHSKDVAIVIGAGATGSWLATALAKLGINKLIVCDFDILEEHNLPNQCYSKDNVGMYKVKALKKLLLDSFSTNPNGDYDFINAAITSEDVDVPSTSLEGIINNNVGSDIDSLTIFCLVDSMSARKDILNMAKRVAPMLPNTPVRFIETRMGLTGYRIYDIELHNNKEIDEYIKTLYSDDEAEVSACGTSKSVVSTAMQCASHAVGMWLANKNNIDYLPNEVIFDVQSSIMLSKKFDEGE